MNAIDALRTFGFCDAMDTSEGEGIASEKQCWERRLARKNWCYSCDEREQALAAVEELHRAAEAIAPADGLYRVSPSNVHALAAAVRRVNGENK